MRTPGEMDMIVKAPLLAATVLAALFATSAIAQDFAGKTLVVGTWGGDIERLLREHAAKPLAQR
jgi:putative spermidine/putrescine transport system substrate-binding protein